MLDFIRSGGAPMWTLVVVVAVIVVLAIRAFAALRGPAPSASTRRARVAGALRLSGEASPIGVSGDATPFGESGDAGDLRWLRDVAAAASTIDAILFWGGFAFLTGAVGTLFGISTMAHAFDLAGSAPAPLAWGGLRLALSTSIAGTLVLLFALGAWMVLRIRLRRILRA